MKLDYFLNADNFYSGLKTLFNSLNIPVNYIAEESIAPADLLAHTFKANNPAHQLMDDVFILGMVDDAAFKGQKSSEIDKIKADYEGIIIFGVTLKRRDRDLLPTRSQLAEITRAFNREFHYIPVVVVIKYENFLSLANAERLKYTQKWREGEKVRKVSILRDIDITKPHPGHIKILEELKIFRSGNKGINSFEELYRYWQEVFSVSILNKKFYQELSNWYLWATKQVTFPSNPTETDAHKKKAKLDDLIQEHNATNVIRLLTRLLFTWFIKEKKLIPEDLFEPEALGKDILNEIAPYHEDGLFSQANKDSVYYKAVLQNLFFASLNCPIKPDGLDNRTRDFRRDKNYGDDRGNDWLYRYKKYFKNPDAFLQLMNNTVPFLNGGLFECLDDKEKKLYIDGFSDNLPKEHALIVPDYLFFGIEEHVDLSAEYGISNSGTKNAAVKGLINILKSYKFTIAENTPIEEDVALDPELLGKVFENLLASYNPETQTTARKQTGSFYTPREIVNYMVDESLIAYLKNAVADWGMDKNQVDEKLHQLASFDLKNPFESNIRLVREIIFTLDRCKILDPACGSGAFPMGMMQKMVHILQKLDPDNILWKEIQRKKVLEETEEAFVINDRKEREEKLIEINNAFDQRINDPDYARKLYLIENCIYGVDIQPIATQISKLRFFISLVVDQKANSNADNFGIRPLPNLETRFVTANTLIGIGKPDAQLSLFDTKEINELKTELKHVRHKLFSARTKDTKLKYRQKDKDLRNAIAAELKKIGWQDNSADKLASWDPYDQNATSKFFDPEWMFDIKDGFDVVIGNPPYVFTRDVEFDGDFKKYIEEEYFSKMTRVNKSKANQSGKINLFAVFIIKGLFVSNKNGYLCYIIPNNILRTTTYDIIRRYVLENSHVEQIVDLGSGVFDNVTASTIVLGLSNKKTTSNTKVITEIKNLGEYEFETKTFDQNQFLKNTSYSFNIFMDNISQKVTTAILNESNKLGDFCLEIIPGIDAPKTLIFTENAGDYYDLLEGKCISRFLIKPANKYLKWIPSKINRTRPQHVWDAEKKIITQRISGGTKPLIVALDTNKKRTFNSVNNLILKPEKAMMYEPLEVILNSDLINWYYANNFSNNSELTVNISKTFLEVIPISKNLENKIWISTLTFLSIFNRYCACNSKQHLNEFFSVSNALVFELYFSNHMKEREIDVLQFVERDIQEVMQGRDFEKLSDSEKEQVIEQLHQTWTKPDNEVRNRMKLFAVRSPEILKPILES